MPRTFTPIAFRLCWLCLPILALGGCSAATGGGGGGGSADDDVENGEMPDDGSGPVTLESLNEGGGDLAERLGSTSFSGMAEGPTLAGSISMSFDADGVLTTLGGTIVGRYFGLPADTDIQFDYLTETVEGTVRQEGQADQALEDFLEARSQSITFRRVVVVFAANSLFIETTYRANTTGQSASDTDIKIEATLLMDAEGNRRLQGALDLPNLTDPQDPEFTLEAD